MSLRAENQVPRNRGRTKFAPVAVPLSWLLNRVGLRWIDPAADERRDVGFTRPGLASIDRRASLSLEPAAVFVETGRKRGKKRWLRLLFIMTPPLLAALYCFVLATPMYLSSARFTIRGQAEGGGSALGKLFQSSGGGAAFTDGFAVRDYLSSPDAMVQLDRRIGFLARMQRPRGDLFFNLPTGEPRESQLGFYRSMVKVRYNMVESIVSLDVSAFSPDDAFVIARDLTSLAGEFSNELNRRGTEETLRVALSDVAGAEQRMSKARLSLADWRKANGSLDLEANAKMIQLFVQQTEVQLIEVNAELEQIKASQIPNNPRRRLLEERQKTLAQQLERENGRLTSAQNASVVNLLSEYQRLTLEQDFANKSYELTLQSLNNAQTVANMRQKFVATIVAPNLPERSSFPDPFNLITLALIAAIFSWLIGSLVYSVVRENQAG